jgi:hypothetical protein
LLGPVSQGALYDPLIAMALIVAVAREQADAVAVTLQDQAKAVEFYLVQPIGTGWHFGGAGWNAGLENVLADHVRKICQMSKNTSLSSDI